MDWNELYKKYGKPPQSSKKKWLIIIVVCLISVASIGIVYYDYFSKGLSKYSFVEKPSSAQSSSSTVTITTITDNSNKCLDAGGECKANCMSETTGSTLGSFLQDPLNWLSGSLTSFLQSIASWLSGLLNGNGSSIKGQILIIPISQEIGNYPEYCTQQLPECCKPITTTTTSSSTLTTTPSTMTPTSSPTSISSTTTSGTFLSCSESGDKINNQCCDSRYYSCGAVINSNDCSSPSVCCDNACAARQEICLNAAGQSICNGLDIAFGEGYRSSCCSNYGKCC